MDVPRHWRLKAQRYRLEGSACPICGRLSFPPRPVCPDCITRPERSADTELLKIHPSDRFVEPILPERMIR